MVVDADVEVHLGGVAVAVAHNHIVRGVLGQGTGAVAGPGGALNGGAGLRVIPLVCEVLGILGGGLAFLSELGLYQLVTGRVVTSLTGSFIRVIPITQVALPMFIAFMGTGILVGVFGGVNAIRNYLKV